MTESTLLASCSHPFGRRLQRRGGGDRLLRQHDKFAERFDGEVLATDFEGILRAGRLSRLAEQRTTIAVGQALAQLGGLDAAVLESLTEFVDGPILLPDPPLRQRHDDGSGLALAGDAVGVA